MTRKWLIVLPLLLVVVSAENCDHKPSSVEVEERATEANQQRMLTAVPLPNLQQSLERQNLSRRLERVNRANLTSYIYLVSQTGKVMAFYTVNGKVTSLNAYLTPESRNVNYGSAGVAPIELPDLDGAYGKNSDGVFFFTTENVYVEWHGDYLWSDQPLKLTQQPELLYQIPTSAK